MGLSNYIDEIIERNYKAIISDVPFKHILIDFRIADILSSEEVNQLLEFANHKIIGFKFLEILKTRSDVEFERFCNILKLNEIENVQSLGRKLETAANEKGQAQS